MKTESLPGISFVPLNLSLGGRVISLGSWLTVFFDQTVKADSNEMRIIDLPSIMEKSEGGCNVKPRDKEVARLEGNPHKSINIRSLCPTLCDGDAGPEAKKQCALRLHSPSSDDSTAEKPDSPNREG